MEEQSAEIKQEQNHRAALAAALECIARGVNVDDIEDVLTDINRELMGV